MFGPISTKSHSSTVLSSTDVTAVVAVVVVVAAVVAVGAAVVVVAAVVVAGAAVVAVVAAVAQSHSGEQKSFFLHPSSFYLSLFFIPKLGPQIFHSRSIFFDFNFFLYRLHLQVFVKLFHHLFQMSCLVFPFFFLFLLPLLLIFRFAILFLFYLFF